MENEYIKRFDEWNTLKKDIDARDPIEYFSAREIWWCSVGVNIGSEIDGKNELFERPVLIIRRINNDRLLIAPLTSRIDTHPYRINIHISENESQILLLQIQTISSKRLTRRIKVIKRLLYLHILIRLSTYILKGDRDDETPQ